MRQPVGIGAFGGIAALAALSNAPRKKPQPRHYREFCGPPHPKSRQHLRALMRQAEAARVQMERKATEGGAG